MVLLHVSLEEGVPGQGEGGEVGGGESTSVTRCANPSMGMSAIIRAYSLNLLPGMELG